MSEFRDSLGRFKQGYQNNEPVDDKIKRMYSLQESWKAREGYIGDIKDVYPRIYNSWRSIKYTQKGKKVGNSPEWDSFRNFYNDVMPSYKKGLIFRRLDTTRQYSKDNFIWVTNEEAVLLQSNLIWLTHDDKTMPLKQWGIELGVSLSGLKYRYNDRKNKNYTIEEILWGRKVKRFSKTPKDKSHNTSIRSKASKMISSYKIKDRRRNLEICDIDVDWMIDNIFNKNCIYCDDDQRIGCDRIDNLKGHIKENVVPCCYECNVARGDNFSMEEMLILGQTIKNIKHARHQ